MAAIVLTNFSGEQPHISPRLMPDNAAQIAQNVRLGDGSLRPMNVSTLVATPAGSANWETLIKHDGAWIGWNTVVDAAPGPVATERLYYTGDGVPKMRVSGTVYPLAVPRPTVALTATLGGSGTGDITTRVYAYTFVTDFGEETEPCDLSNQVDWQPGNTVTLSGFQAAPGGRNITKQRIYRSQTGSAGTTLYFIAERAASAANYIDSIAVDDFKEPIPSLLYNAPPDTLEGMTALPNGMMAGFDGKKLYFSEPYRPHAWPEAYILTTDYLIVGIEYIAGSLIVLTTGTPYIVQGGTPDTMQMARIEQNFPCINARGVVDMGYAVAYPTHEGLALVSPSGMVTLATANIFSKDKWTAYSPATMIGAMYAGRYAAFYDTINDDGMLIKGLLLIDPSGGGYLIRMDIYAKAVWYSVEDSLLYYINPAANEILSLDATSAGKLTLFWRSKPFYLPTPVNFAAIKISAKTDITQAEIAVVNALIADVIAHNEAVFAAGFTFGPMATNMMADSLMAADDLLPVPSPLTTQLNVNIYADGELVFSVTEANTIERLPDGFKAHVWEIEVYTNLTVDHIAMATSVEELKQIA